MLPIDFYQCENCANFFKDASIFCVNCANFVSLNDDGFDDDKERPFENIDIDGSPLNSWMKEDDDENKQYLSYCSGL